MKEYWNCPIAIATYNRPDYLSKCLEKFSRSNDIEEYNPPFFVFCDGGDCATVEQNLNIIKKHNFISETIVQSKNLGIASHIHLIRKMLFDKMKFDRIIVFEDDILPSNYYYRYVNRCLDYVKKIDNRIVMVNSCTLCSLPIDKKMTKRQEYVYDMHAHLNNYVMLRDAWNLIEPVMSEYIDRFIKPYGSYVNRMHYDIIRWSRKIELPPEQKKKMDELASQPASSQDRISILAIRSAGMYYVSSYVNRILNIGINGENFTSNIFSDLGMDKMTLDEISADRDRKIFILKNLFDLTSHENDHLKCILTSAPR